MSEPSNANITGVRAHEPSPECWCKPRRFRLCEECESVAIDEGGNARRKLGVSCWKCDGEGVVPVVYGDPIADSERIVLMHR